MKSPAKLLVNNKKSIAFILMMFVFFFSSIIAKAQVGGISGSKLDAYCVDVVDHHKIEFEPAFFHFSSRATWDDDGHLEDIYGSSDSVFHNTGINFRFTYGLWDKLEIGASISTDLQVSNWGARYILYQNNKVGVAVIAGANIGTRNSFADIAKTKD